MITTEGATLFVDMQQYVVRSTASIPTKNAFYTWRKQDTVLEVST
jgi:hypothetical protein